MKTVIQRYIAGDKKLQTEVEDYITGVRGELTTSPAAVSCS